MTIRFTGAFAAAMTCMVVAITASAQPIDLGAGGSEQVWRGTAVGAQAGLHLDQGAVSGGDSRRDLVVGAPGGPGLAGRVYIIFGGPVRSGELSLASAQATLTAGAAGDLFGWATASGNIWNVESSIPRALVVGAPGAGSGAGRVYLFKGGFSQGTSLTAASALLEIRGQPGDRLGSALATADLNGDGFREIIIGAPGSNRVYVINGGAALNQPSPVIRTLSPTQPADIVITGASIGGTLAAGEVTGDARSDVLIAGDNRVFLLKGRPGLPSTIDLGAAPNADVGVLLGINVWDVAGTSIRVGDFDADRTGDLVISAPGGDGQAEERTDAGETYVLWGGSALVQSLWPGGIPTGRSLATADVTFYGGAAQDLLAYGVTSGDINRDAPDDLVIIAPNADGEGIAYIYYGRSRSNWGSLRSDGRRFVDFADRSRADRLIIGDRTEGKMLSSQVFEVTGEGARDLVLGIPGSESNTGSVHFTISPKLLLSQDFVSVSLVVNAGQSFARQIRVGNSSPVPITWAVTSQASWLSANPPSGSAVLGSDGIFNLVASASGLSPGTYTGRVNVSSTSHDLEMTLSIVVTITVAPPVRSDGDFSGDGTLDILWQHDTQGWLALWRMSGTDLLGGSNLGPGRVPDTNWKIAGTGDFNGDGHPDLLWQHAAEGWIAVWTMNGTQLVGTFFTTPNRVADTNWRIAATGDFNRDGKRDIVWQHQTTGKIAVWMMDGLTMMNGAFMTPSEVTDTNWKIVGAADFNGDGHVDLLWQHLTQGHVAVWVMSGTTLLSGQILNRVTDNGWRIRSVGDLNNDRRPDVLWQHTNGTVAVWFTNGLGFAGAALLNPSSVPAGWSMSGPR